jgi:hypothetical protein
MDVYNPDSIMKNFESSTLESSEENLSNSTHEGKRENSTNVTLSQCSVGFHFQFVRRVWRHIQNDGLSSKYNADESFRFNVRKLLALAFVPVTDVIQAYEQIAGDFDDEAENFLNYFEKTWIGPLKRGGERKLSHSLCDIILSRSWPEEATIRTSVLERLLTCCCQSTSLEQLCQMLVQCFP